MADPSSQFVISITTLDDTNSDQFPPDKTHRAPQTGRASRPAKQRSSVAVDKLNENFKGFVDAFAQVLKGIDGSLGDYRLEEITLQVEILAGGQVSLLGSGAYGEVTSAAALTFKRKG